MSFVDLKDVGKIYQTDGPSTATQVLSGINLSIEEGEFVSLVGPSGSGKSTLLSIIGAMNRPTQGTVVIDEIDVYRLSEERRADFRHEYLGFIFQQQHLLPFLTAIENVMLPLAISKISAAEKKQRAISALEKVGLADKAARLPNQLSGGEQERVAIARAIVNNPPLLLADEPTGSLDSKTGAEVMDVFRRLNKHGQTILMVTHNPEYAALSNRIIKIRDGKIDE